MATTTTKCMSKMNKKELYEYCKILVDENKKLQLFNNAQEQENKQLLNKIKYLEETLTEESGNWSNQVVVLEKQIHLMKTDCWTEKHNKLLREYKELEEHLEYFQNKCETLERELLEVEPDGRSKIEFLKEYIVPNWYKPEDLGVKEEEVEDFKEYVEDWVTMGNMNDIMTELLDNFRKENE